MSKHHRRIRQEFAQRISDDLVLTRMGELGMRNIAVLTRALLLPNLDSKKAIITEGLISSPGAGLSVDLTSPAVAVQDIGGGDVVPVLSNDAYNVVIPTANLTNPRIDVIEARIETREAFTDTRVDKADPITKSISSGTVNRDFETFLKLQVVAGTPAVTPVPPSTTAGTPGQLIGSVTTDVLDCSTQNILNIAFGVDGELTEVDISGTSPATTTLAERIAAINTAFIALGTVAFNTGGALEIRVPGTGENSVFKIKQPLDDDADAYGLTMGGAQSPAYFDQFIGDNEFFKVAEIFVPISAASLTAGNVRSIEDKDTEWDSDAATIENGFSFEGHRKTARMDHPDASVFLEHLDAGVAAGITQKLTLFREAFAPVYPVPGDPTGGRKGTIFLHNIDVRTILGATQTLQDQEQEFPVNRADQRQDDVSGAGYTVLTSLSEAPADKIGNFVPDDINFLFTLDHSRTGIYINSAGSGYTDLHIEIHDAGDTQLAVVDIPIGFLTTGWNFGNLLATLLTAQTYHYHVFVIGFTAGSTPILANDGGGVISYREMYLPSGGKFGSANTADVIHILDSTGTDLIPVRGAGVDAISSPGDGFIGESGFDLMAVDLSSDALWNSTGYQDYVLIDLLLGRIKLPAALALDELNPIFITFNVSEGLDETDAKNFLRHSRDESIEDNLEKLDNRSFLPAKFTASGTILKERTTVFMHANESKILAATHGDEIVNKNDSASIPSPASNTDRFALAEFTGGRVVEVLARNTGNALLVITDGTGPLTSFSLTVAHTANSTDITSLDSGNIAIAWSVPGTPDLRFEIRDSSGTIIAGPTVISTDTVRNVRISSLTGKGLFAVVWGTSSKVRYAIFNDAGSVSVALTDLEVAIGINSWSAGVDVLSLTELPIPSNGDVRFATVYQTTGGNIKYAIIDAVGVIKAGPTTIEAGSDVSIANINRGKNIGSFLTPNYAGAEFAIVWLNGSQNVRFASFEYDASVITAASTVDSGTTNFFPRVTGFDAGRYENNVAIIYAFTGGNVQNQLQILDRTGAIIRRKSPGFFVGSTSVIFILGKHNGRNLFGISMVGGAPSAHGTFAFVTEFAGISVNTVADGEIATIITNGKASFSVPASLKVGRRYITAPGAFGVMQLENTRLPLLDDTNQPVQFVVGHAVADNEILLDGPADKAVTIELA